MGLNQNKIMAANKIDIINFSKQFKWGTRRSEFNESFPEIKLASLKDPSVEPGSGQHFRTFRPGSSYEHQNFIIAIAFQKDKIQTMEINAGMAFTRQP